MVNEQKHVVVDKKQMNISKSVNQQIKIQKIVLNQLVKELDVKELLGIMKNCIITV